MRQGELHCENPNASLYTFVGNLLLGPPLVPKQVTLSLSPASVLLRGSALRNTRSVLGAVIFAGHDTKACNTLILLSAVYTLSHCLRASKQTI